MRTLRRRARAARAARSPGIHAEPVDNALVTRPLNREGSDKSGATLSLGGGLGGGLYAGVLATYTKVHPYTITQVLDTIWKTFSTERPEHTGGANGCPRH